MKTLDSHIEITPGIVGGKPRIAGHRITVQNIAIWHERMGKNVDEIAAEYDLTLADVHAALAYYFDHREEIDRAIEESEAYVEALRQRTPSKVQQKLEPLPPAAWPEGFFESIRIDDPAFERPEQGRPLPPAPFLD